MISEDSRIDILLGIAFFLIGGTMICAILGWKILADILGLGFLFLFCGISVYDSIRTWLDK